MRVVASNCGCCAIKHIRDFEYSPDEYVYIELEGHNGDQESSEPLAYRNWAYSDDVLRNGSGLTGGEVLRAYVTQIKRRRPSGIITLNLVSYMEYDCWCCEDCDGPRPEGEYNYQQVNNWLPILEELGFSEVTVRNSNSGNLIHHFTLVYDEWDSEEE